MSKERLTERTQLGSLIQKSDVSTRQMIDKLAEYEDLEERLEKMFSGKLPLEKYVDDLELALKEPNSPHPMNARILTYAESVKWDEYCKLEEQGLLLRLPARNIFESNGDTVYYIYDFEIVECINCGISIDCEGNIWIALACDEDIFPYRNPDAEHDLDPTDWCKNATEVKLEEWGKTVFLTQSEAEEKLRELEGK